MGTVIISVTIGLGINSNELLDTIILPVRYVYIVILINRYSRRIIELTFFTPKNTPFHEKSTVLIQHLNPTISFINQEEIPIII